MFKNDHAYFNITMKTKEAKVLLSNYKDALEKEIHADAVKYYNRICKNMRLRVMSNYINRSIHLLELLKHLKIVRILALSSWVLIVSLLNYILN